MSRFTLSLRNLQRPAGNSATVSSSRTRSLVERGVRREPGTGTRESEIRYRRYFFEITVFK